MCDLETRILKLEKVSAKLVPGTALTRILKHPAGGQWCLALGNHLGDKVIFLGDTIEEVVGKAEACFAKELEAAK